MKKSFTVLALCLSSLAMHGQKTRYGQELPKAKPGDVYPLNVHILGVHYRAEGVGSGQVADVIYADAIMNGKKLELRGDQAVPFQYNVQLGDHHARLLKDPHKTGNLPLSQEYEVLLPDRTIWHCTVTGISE